MADGADLAGDSACLCVSWNKETIGICMQTRCCINSAAIADDWRK